MGIEPMRHALPRVDLTESIYFITAVTHQRKPIFAQPENVTLLLDTLRRVKETHPFTMIGYAILPDHAHLMTQLKGETRISKLMGSLKRNFTRNLKTRDNIESELKIWQHRFFDHVIRDEKDLQKHLHYIHYNPVKHGLVNKPELYPYSSYLDYVKREWYELGWGHTEIPYDEKLDLGGE